MVLCGQGRRHHVSDNLGSVRATATSTSWCHLYACVTSSHEPWHQGWCNPHCLSLIPYTKCCHMMRGCACPTGLGSRMHGHLWREVVLLRTCSSPSTPRWSQRSGVEGSRELLLALLMLVALVNAYWSLRCTIAQGGNGPCSHSCEVHCRTGRQGPHTGARSPTHAKL